MEKEIKHKRKQYGGNNHFVALKANGTVWSWGYNGYGQIACGDTKNKVEPVQMKAQIKYIDEDTEEEKTREEHIEDAIDIATGTYYTVVLRKDGTVWTAGQNNYGQLGTGDTANKSYLVQVKGLNGV